MSLDKKDKETFGNKGMSQTDKDRQAPQQKEKMHEQERRPGMGSQRPETGRTTGSGGEQKKKS